jgi:hypothetical protein
MLSHRHARRACTRALTHLLRHPLFTGRAADADATVTWPQGTVIKSHRQNAAHMRHPAPSRPAAHTHARLAAPMPAPSQHGDAKMTPGSAAGAAAGTTLTPRPSRIVSRCRLHRSCALLSAPRPPAQRQRVRPRAPPPRAPRYHLPLKASAARCWHAPQAAGARAQKPQK